MKTRLISGADPQAVAEAAAVLRAGGLIAFPTDTVYGVGAVHTDRAAVLRIYEVKGRAADRPIALLLSDTDRLAEVAVLPEAARSLVQQFWPGGLTLVLAKTERVSDEVSRGATVGVRIPDHALARALIQAGGGVLAVTSANRSGQPEAHTAAEAWEQLGGQIELVVDGGRCPGGVASTVLDCTTWPPVVLRQGVVDEAAIRCALGQRTLGG